MFVTKATLPEAPMWLPLVAFAYSADGTVSLPLDQWVRMLDEAEESAAKGVAPAPFLQVDRTVDGAFRRGVFTGILTTRLQVLSVGGGTRVPILDAGASIAKVELDGRRTSLLAENGS